MKNFLLLLLLLSSFHPLYSQSKPVKILFDITSKDTATYTTVVRHVAGIAKSHPEAQLEVVIYGGALPMVLTGKSTKASAIQQLTRNNNVTFKVCEVTMKRYNVASRDLLPGVTSVPDAIIEIASKQGEGWGYIKEGQN